MNPKKGDYFTRGDVERLSPEAWEQVRSEFRKLGFRVSNHYGNHQRGTYDASSVTLDGDGDLVWRGAYAALGKRLDPKDFLPKPKIFEAVKFKAEYNADRLQVAINHLLTLGYKLSSDAPTPSSAGDYFGVHGNALGQLILVLSSTAFVNLDAEEYTFGVLVERKIFIKDIERVRKYVKVQGVQCETKALEAFLQSQKSARESACCLV